MLPTIIFMDCFTSHSEKRTLKQIDNTTFQVPEWPILKIVIIRVDNDKVSVQY